MNLLLAQIATLSPRPDALPGSDVAAPVLHGILFYILIFFLVLGVPIAIAGAVMWAVGASKEKGGLRKAGMWTFFGVIAAGIAFFLLLVLIRLAA